jgi:hypothetical protein
VRRYGVIFAVILAGALAFFLLGSLDTFLAAASM